MKQTFRIREHRLLPLEDDQPADWVAVLFAAGFLGGLVWRELWQFCWWVRG